MRSSAFMSRQDHYLPSSSAARFLAEVCVQRSDHRRTVPHPETLLEERGCHCVWPELLLQEFAGPAGKEQMHTRHAGVRERPSLGCRNHSALWLGKECPYAAMT